MPKQNIPKDKWTLTVTLDADGAVIVSDKTFCQYGRGATLEAACSDYAYALFEYWAAAAEFGTTPVEAGIVGFLQPFLLGKESAE
jgi:hypothetical protein